jgi:hypothetical protein
MACATVTGFPACQSQIEAWLSCARSAAVVCDPSGVPSFEGCDTQLAFAAGCAATTPPPKVVQKSCGDYCNQIEAAGCDATTPLGDCSQTCGLAGTVIADCQANFIKYLDCMVGTGESCDANGQLNTSICTAQQFVYMGCVFSAVGTATIPSGTGGTPAK